MNQLLTEKEAAQTLGLSVRTLQGWRRVGGGPRFLSLSRRAVRYRIEDIETWMDSHAVENTTEAEMNRRDSVSRESENKNVRCIQQK